MKFKQVITKTGNSHCIILPEIIMKNLDYKKGDEILVEILEKIEKIKEYRCKKCQHKFQTNDEFPYCSACSSTNLEETENEWE